MKAAFKIKESQQQVKELQKGTETNEKKNKSWERKTQSMKPWVLPDPPRSPLKAIIDA